MCCGAPSGTMAKTKKKRAKPSALRTSESFCTPFSALVSKACVTSVRSSQILSAKVRRKPASVRFALYSSPPQNELLSTEPCRESRKTGKNQCLNMGLSSA